MDNEKLLSHAEKFGFGKVYDDKSEPDLYYYQYFVEARGFGKWAVTKGQLTCYDSKKKDFVREPTQSSRTDEFLETTRFSLEEAVNIVQRYSLFCYDYCIFLNIKEHEQNGMKDKPDHICLKYNKIVKHGAFHPKLVRCKECQDDD
jgi:hypothetical protein